MRTVFAVANDLHVASPFAVCPARWLTHDGIELLPNGLQAVINDFYRTCWQHVADLRKGARLIAALVGDATEGTHHDTTQVTTTRLDTQEQMAAAVIDEGLRLAKFKFRRNSGDVLRFVTGTGAHDGNGSASLERIARIVLDTDVNLSGRVTRDMWDCAINGTRFILTHKPGSGPGARLQTQGNAFQSWLKSLYYGALETGLPVPRYVLTAHHHQYLQRHIYAANGEQVMTGIMLPAWKVKDEYVYRVAPFALASIGMVAFEITDSGKVTPHVWRLEVAQDAMETL